MNDLLSMFDLDDTDSDELVVRLRKADEAYYNDTAEIDDHDYDAWKDRLRELDPTNSRSRDSKACLFAGRVHGTCTNHQQAQ